MIRPAELYGGLPVDFYIVEGGESQILGTGRPPPHVYAHVAMEDLRDESFEVRIVRPEPPVDKPNQPADDCNMRARDARNDLDVV